MPRLRCGLVVAFAACLYLIAFTHVEAACNNDPTSTCTSTQCCYDDIPVVLGIGGDVTPNQDCYDSGTSINYECTGDLAGPPFNNCNGGAWSFAVGPTCTADVKCPQPPIPIDGGISPDQTEYEKYTTITYSCDSGFTLTGPQQSTCESDGTWNPTTTPTCDANCDPPTIPNGSFTPDSEFYVNGEVINYECDANFTLVGITSTTCRDGAFDPSNVPNCYGKCNPPVVADSDYDTQQPIVEHGSTITITCDTQFSTGTGTETDLQCIDGVFNNEVPVCYANCLPLDPFANGETGGATTPFYHDETVTFTCNSGYTLVGSASITCNDGEWTDDQPVCYENCVLSGVPNSNSTSSYELSHGGSIVITCDSGFSNGNGISTEVTCNDGVNSPDPIPSCFADCPAPIIPNSDYSTAQENLVHLQEFNVTCDAGYSNGDQIYFTQTCDNGQTSGGDPTCYQDCPEFSIEDGSISGDTPPYWHTETVVLTCDTNFTLVGVETLSCSNGNWSDPYPTCESDCLPPVIPNSNYSSQLPTATHGTSFVIGCDVGYSTGSTTTQTITCTDSVLSPTPQGCYSDCTPPIVANSDYATQQDDVLHTSEFTVTCNTNYSVGSCVQTTPLTCTDGELDGNVTCYADCSDPGTPVDGSREFVGDEFCHGTTVIYECDTRFDLNGAESIECRNGEWSDVMPNCTETALYDLIMLTCGPESMEVEIPTELLGEIGPTDLGLQGNLSCAAYLDGDLMRLNTSLAGCGTNKTENGTHDTYRNRVVNNYYDDTITRVADVQIPMTCSYARNQQVRALRYAIDDYVIGKNLEETGTYTMTFGIYSSGNYAEEDQFVGGQAVDIPIDDPLYFRLELVTDVADNSLVVQSCWATPTEDDSSSTNHQLVNNRCPVDETFQYSITNPNGGKTVDFVLNSFRFVVDDDKEVYVHCEVFVCHSDSTDSFCDESCGAASRRRRRRDIDDDESSLIARSLLLETGDDRTKRASIHDPVVKYVKAGPIHWQSEGKNKPAVHAQVQEGPVVDEAGQAAPMGTSNQSTTAMMHSVIGLGAIIAVFSIVLLVVVRHYRRRLHAKEYTYKQLQTCS